MDEHRVRIRAVRLKRGGEVRVLPDPARAIHEWLAKRLKDEVGWIPRHGRLAGFALMLWGADGRVGATFENTLYSPYGRDALPNLCADALRQALTREQMAMARN